MNLTNTERETIIWWDCEMRTAEVYSCERRIWTKMTKLMKRSDKVRQIAEFRDKGHLVSQTYTMPKKWVSLTARSKRILTPEQRNRLSDRAKKTFGSKQMQSHSE